MTKATHDNTAAHLCIARDEHGVVVGEALQAVEGVERLAALQNRHRGLQRAGGARQVALAYQAEVHHAMRSLYR